MKSADTPSDWSQLLRGTHFAEQLQRRLDDWAPSLFGFNLLKVDALSASLSLTDSRLLHSVYLSQVATPKQDAAADVLGDACALPFSPGSLDACLLAHVLDFSEHPHAILREVEVGLHYDGWLIVSGFNPYSSAGLASLMFNLSLNPEPAGHGKLPRWKNMIAPGRVEDWLKLLGFEVINRDYIGLTRLFDFASEGAWRRRCYPRYCPSLSAAYIIMARKRRYPLTPIRQYQPTKPVLQPGMARQQQQLKSGAKLNPHD
ncbi:class I SAM-dependent methyltransferase [Oceanisphaera pacifica]|uniref:Methyltransferase domain-containing protein n=1 Tax=Oceanisphaera pacifica TaxID=2818389 RepID=A0ABS3NGV1_9GAMM|nr:methyltransferase domain-containing protein [Oceanisphaera pacifica]MBO1519821.1 methyltransferase domain-containing protein [Oceanisphaera pacifica]